MTDTDPIDGDRGWSPAPALDAQAMTAFRDLMELAGPARRGALQALPAAVRRRVQAMLSADQDSHAFVDAPPALGVAAALAGELDAPMPDPDLPLPERLGRYRVTALLGAGGMGIVYLADQEEPRRSVAIKVLRQEYRRKLAEQFRREADALAAIVHPGIPQVYEIGVESGAPWMAMELVHGVPLDAWARARGEEDRLEIVHVMVSVCDAVHVAHQRGLVHRDLKPDNILVTADGQPKVMDFGLVAPVGDATAVCAGTRGYMGPDGTRVSSPAATDDVFAFGRILEGQATRLPRPYSEDLCAIIAQATAERPEDRYADAGELAEDLRRLLRSEPVRARRQTPWYLLRRFSWRHRAVGRTLAVVAGLLVVSLIVWTALGALLDARLEARTHAALSRLAPTVDQELAAGRSQEAVALVAASIDSEGGGATSAASRAWRELAARLTNAAQAGIRRQVLARAYLAASGTERAEVLRDVVRDHLGQLDRVGAERALASLANVDHVEPALEARVRTLSRDLLRAASVAPDAPGGPMWAALGSGATRLPYKMWGAFPVRVGGQDRLLLVDQENDLLTLAERDGQLTPWAQAPFPPQTRVGFGLPRGIGGSWMLRRRTDGRAEVLDLSCSTAGHLCMTSFGIAPLGLPLDAVKDGNRAILGFGPSSVEGAVYRTLGLLEADGRFEQLDREFGAAASDVGRLRLADTDDDGEDELIAVLGPWRAFDVRILERTPEGWATRTRRRLGDVGGIQVMPGSTLPQIVLVKNDSYPSAKAWPPGQPYGERRGLYRLEDRGDSLHQVQFVEVPVPSRFNVSRLVVGDFDGDGHADLAAEITLANATWLLRGQPDGSLQDAGVIMDMVPLHATQLDADGADELLVRIPSDAHHTWLLGVGDRVLPRLAHELKVEVPDAVSGPVRGLAEAGMVEEAARAIQRSAEGQAAGERALRHRWAAEVLEALGDRHQAALGFEAAALADPIGQRDALERAAELWGALHQPDRRRRAHLLLQGSDPDPVLDHPSSPGRDALVWLARHGTPPEPEWVPHQPLSVRMYPPGTLSLDMVGSKTSALVRNVVYEGGAFELTIEVDLISLGFGSGIRMQLSRGDASLFEGRLSLLGGGQRAELLADCRGERLMEGVGGRGPALTPGRLDTRVRLSLRGDPAVGTVRCTLTLNDGEVVMDGVSGLQQIEPGPVRFELGNVRHGYGRVQADVRRLSLTGFTSVPTELTAAHRVSRGDTAAGLALDDPATAAMAALRLGQLETARARLAEVPPELPLPPVVGLSVLRLPHPTLDILHAARPDWSGDLLRLAAGEAEYATAEVRTVLLHPVIGARIADRADDAQHALVIAHQLITWGDLDRARNLLERVSESLGAQHREIHAQLMLERARLAAMQGQPDRAAALCDDALALSGDPVLLRTLARLDPVLAALLDEP